MISQLSELTPPSQFEKQEGYSNRAIALSNQEIKELLSKNKKRKESNNNNNNKTKTTFHEFFKNFFDSEEGKQVIKISSQSKKLDTKFVNLFHALQAHSEFGITIKILKKTRICL